jgi:hypothetical protein
MVRCPIVNVRVVGQRCGFGEGRTWAEARKAALEQAEIYYPGRILNPDDLDNVVEISMECYI